MSDVTALLQGNKLIDVDANGQIAQPVLVLSSRGGDKIGVIQNVSNINVTHPLADVAELSFDVTKEIDGNVYADWYKIKDFKFIQMPYDNTWFEATVSIDEENEIVKHVTCTHANESELGQLNLYETEINTESDIGRSDYVETVFYDEENHNASLLHRILKDKAPHYQIYHVDDSLKGLFRVFSFNGDSIQDALNKIADEVNCLFVYGEWSENDGKYHRTISAYDLEDYCQECHTRGEFHDGVCTNCGSTNIVSGYGEDTEIFISKENLAQSINYSSNTDNMKNCFRLVAGDDVMTSAIKSCNPSMSQYMWHFSDDMLEDMSDELAAKITEYEALVESYKNDIEIDIPSAFIESSYNSLVDKYDDINDELVKITTPITGTVELTEAYYNALNMYGFLKSEMMPPSEKVTDTTAAEQLALLKGGDFTEVGIASVSGFIPYTTANSAIQAYAKVFIDTSRYKINVFTNSINDTTWTGTITVTSYGDDEDTATDTFTITLFDSTNNAKYADWLTQSVQKTMASRETSNVSVTNLFKKNEDISTFKNRLKLYSLDYLNIMSSMATSAITVMSEQGVASQDSLDTDIYTQLYLPYLEKSRAIQDEIAVRETELSGLLQPTDEDGVQNPAFQNKGLIDIIEEKQNEIREALDLHDYLGDALWEELSFYRRESEYSNPNYISDGLTDSEVIEQAQNFINTATKEIIKASTLQHTISAPLSNFLLLDEFSGLQKKFRVGNWIWLQVDDSIYKLRLANWEVDYDNIDDLDIEFTDSVRVGNVISDVESILSKSMSMATTYDYTARQADKGKDASETVQFFKDSGIDFKAVKAIVSRGNTNIVYDDDGILLKRVDGFRDCPEQARIYNNGIYITRDAWETVSTGLGHFSYVDPETGETVETYGIIADTVIGKLILGENLKIYSESGKFEMGDDGLKVTAIDGEDNTDLFVVQKQKTDEQGRTYVEKYIYVDSNGDVKIAGNSITIGAKPLTEYIDDEVDSQIGDQVDDAKKVATNYLSVDNTGIMVADMQDGEQLPSGITSGKNVFIDSRSVQIRDGQNTLSSFGSNSVVLGQRGKSRLELSSTEISGISDIGVKNFNIINGDSSEERTITKNGTFNNTSSEENIFDGSFIVSDEFHYFHNITASVTFNYVWDGQQETTDLLTLNIDDPVEDETPIVWHIGRTSSSPLYNIDEEINCYVQHDTGVTRLFFDAKAELKPKTTSVLYEMGNIGTYSVVIETKTYQNTSYTFGSRVINSEHGANSFAIGEGLVASSDNQIAIGRYNNDDPEKNYAFMIGNGIYGESRTNAFTVDWNGRTEMGDISGYGLQLLENSQSEMDNYIECIDVNDDTVFSVSKTGAVNSIGRVNASSIKLQKDSATPTDYIQCQDENNNVKFNVTNNGDITTEGDITSTGDADIGGDLSVTGDINALGNINMSGLIQYNNKPMFKVVNKTFTAIGIDSGRAYTVARDIAIDGYKPMSIGGIKLTNNSAYNPSTNVDASWCVIPAFWLDYSTTIDHPNVQSDSIYFYIWNMHGSSGVNVDFHARIVYIATDALGNS